jgi:outer membrane immunogenic protein
MHIHTITLLALLSATGVQAQDWTGPYAGLGISRADGDQASASLSFPLEGTPVSIFGGFNVQSGNLVYGGELAIHNDNATLTGFPAISYNRLTDLKGRIGYATGRTLVYGVLAFSKAEYQNGPIFFDDLGGFTFTYGIGADVMVSDRVFAGAEYMHREFDHTLDPDVTSNYSTLTLRLGMKF